MNASRISGSGRQEKAFTLAELIIVFGVLSIFLLLLFAGFPRVGAKSQRVRCANNLKNLALASRTLDIPTAASPAGTSDPPPWTTAAEYVKSRSNEFVNALLLICPTDTRKPAFDLNQIKDSNISYFVNPDTSDSSVARLLIGDRNLALNGVPVIPGLLALSSNQIVGWTKEMHGRFTGEPNGTVALGDGSVQHLNSPRLQSMVQKLGSATNVLLVP
jgi:type II secretory pathway pseudopilin PulG